MVVGGSGGQGSGCGCGDGAKYVALEKVRRVVSSGKQLFGITS